MHSHPHTHVSSCLVFSGFRLQTGNGTKPALAASLSFVPRIAVWETQLVPADRVKKSDMQHGLFSRARHMLVMNQHGVQSQKTIWHLASRPYSKLQVKEREALRITRPPELVREFIQDCLYSSNEGYFSRHVNIFSKGSESAIDWPSLKDENAYLLCLQALYRRQAEKGPEGANSTSTPFNFQQLWHTPTVLFEPWYGYAVAKAMAEKMRERGDSKLIVYEVGPGNATLCLSVLDYLRKHEPALYATAEYHLIEISPLLHAHQTRAVSASHHASHVTCHHRSILDWTRYEREHCFVLAFELLVSHVVSSCMS